MRFFRTDAHPQQPRKRPGLFASALLLIAPLVLIGTSVDSSARKGGDGTAALRSAAGDGATINATGKGGYVRSLRTARGGRIAVPGAGAEARARAFMNRFGDAFVADAARLELVTTRVTEGGGAKASHVRFRQAVDGVPVRAAEAIVHLDDGGVTSATSNLLPSLERIGTSPSVTAGSAVEAAAAVIAKLGGEGVSYSAPALEIFSRGLLDGRGGDSASLAWFVEATGPALRQFIWVGAVDGRVLHHFSQLTDAKNWTTYDSEFTDQQQKTLLRTDGGADLGDADADNAHNFAEASYDLFLAAFGRLSFDDLDGTVISNVRFCSNPSVPPASCGYENAFWDGTQLTYGEGFSAADDVVGHEFTHGVIEYSSNFLYQNQSGALSESYADIFGELVDQASPDGGNDWELAEDLTGGPERHMMTPTIYAQPGKISDGEYYCGTADNGGVHTNSGIGNHAFALLSDGGTYNTVTVTGIGTAKAGEIFYDALTNYLGSTATWADNYAALNTACADIVTGGGGTNGITAGDCTEVMNALDAVEMNDPPCVLPTVTMCTDPQKIPSYVFMDDLEDPNAGGWMLSVDGGFGTDHWGGGFGTPDIFWSDSPYSGSFSFWGYGFGMEGDSSVAMDSSVTVPDDALFLFNGDFSFEPVYDGGVVEYSTDNGGTWMDAAPLMAGGQMYNGTLDPGNPLGARPAFTGAIGGYAPTLLDLNTLSGMPFRARFRMGTDFTGEDFGWFVDDVSMYVCDYPDPHDWNGDQKPDVFWRKQASGLNYLWYLDGNAFVTGAVIPSAGTDWVVGGIGDFNGDMMPDILWRNTSTGENMVWFMNGTAFVSSQAITTVTDQNWEVAAVEDVNNDGIPDVLWRNYSTGAITLWYLDAGLNETPTPLQTVADTNWRIEAMVDFDDDGNPDILWRHYISGLNGIWLMSGTTMTGFVGLSAVPDINWRIVQASDFNGDRTNDILWRNYSTGVNFIWHWNNSGPLSGASMPTVTDTGWAIEN